MFAKPGTYDCAMRYSSLTPKHLPDTVPAPRGIGLKVFGVKGEKIFQNPDNETQDFLMCEGIATRSLTSQEQLRALHRLWMNLTSAAHPRAAHASRHPRDVRPHLALALTVSADSLERNWNDLPTFVEEQKARPDADVACRGGGLAQQHMAAMPEYSQSAYRHGELVGALLRAHVSADRAAKYGMFPKGQAQKDLADWRVKPDDPMCARRPLAGADRAAISWPLRWPRRMPITSLSTRSARRCSSTSVRRSLLLRY